MGKKKKTESETMPDPSLDEIVPENTPEEEEEEILDADDDGIDEEGDEEETEEEAEEETEEEAEEAPVPETPRYEIEDANGVVFNGDTSIRWKFDPEQVTILGIDDNCDDDDPLADENTKSKLDDAQIKSVARDGVIQDILICPKVIGGVLTPVVVDGRHRTRWARAANQRGLAKNKIFIHARCVPAKVPDEVLRAGKHTLNYVRAGRNTMSQAHAVKELHDAGRKTADIAVDIGVSVSTVENLLALASASKQLLDAVSKGTIPVTGAYKLAKLPEAKQTEAVKETLALAKENKSRAKVSDAQAGKKRVKGDKTASTRPGIGKVRKLLDAAKEDEDVLKALSACEPIDFLRWLLGDVSERVLPAGLRLIVKVKKKKDAGEE